MRTFGERLAQERDAVSGCLGDPRRCWNLQHDPDEDRMTDEEVLDSVPMDCGRLLRRDLIQQWPTATCPDALASPDGQDKPRRLRVGLLTANQQQALQRKSASTAGDSPRQHMRFAGLAVQPVKRRQVVRRSPTTSP